MALGRRPEERQQEFWIATGDLPKSAGHPFYQRLEQLLGQGDFDEFAEDLCEPYYAEGGRPSIPPGRYFRMLFVGYFEGIDSQRGIAGVAATACRCEISWGWSPSRTARTIPV